LGPVNKSSSSGGCTPSNYIRFEIEVLNASASGDYMESQVIRSKSVVMVKLRAAALFYFLFGISCGAAQTIGMRALFVSVYEFSDCTAEAGLDP